MRPLPRCFLPLAVMLAGLLVSSCSVMVEKRTVQCKTDDDCAHFAPHPFCVEGVCVESGLGPAGCFYGTPTNDTQYFTQCTSAACLPFDNCARLGLCDGQPLPERTRP